MNHTTLVIPVIIPFFFNVSLRLKIASMGGKPSSLITLFTFNCPCLTAWATVLPLTSSGCVRDWFFFSLYFSLNVFCFCFCVSGISVDLNALLAKGCSRLVHQVLLLTTGELLTDDTYIFMIIQWKKFSITFVWFCMLAFLPCQ